MRERDTKPTKSQCVFISHMVQALYRTLFLINFNEGGTLQFNAEMCNNKCLDKLKRVNAKIVTVIIILCS